eukprot:COSAG06_NODE_23617_length_686_cov_0.996593_1_plen_32_part_01
MSLNAVNAVDYTVKVRATALPLVGRAMLSRLA